MKAKIYHVTTVHPRYDIRIFHKECKSLANLGFNVHLVVGDGEGDERLDGVSFLDIGESSGRFKRFIVQSIKLFRLLRKENADLVHIHDPELLPLAFALSKCGIAVIYDAHEDVPRQILNKPWISKPLRSLLSKAYEFFENFVAKRLTAVVGATEVIGQRYCQIGARAVVVNNYPMLSEFGKPPPNMFMSDLSQICYVGNITRERGIVELVAALEHLDDCTLVLAGRFTDSKLLADLKQMKGWTKVDYRGVLDRGEIVSVLHESKAGLVTLHDIPNYVVSMPIKMFEYMAAGCPVIASNFPLWKKILGDADCGICVNPKDALAVAAVLQDLLANTTRRLEMGVNGRAAVEQRYNWERESTKLLSQYSEILGLDVT